jgi:dihydrofolate reductase
LTPHRPIERKNKMRTVVLYELMSLDGVADEPGEGEWFIDADGRLMDNLTAVIANQDTVLIGRRTYEKWAPHWPTSDMQPFADFINRTPKVLFSSQAPTAPLVGDHARHRTG